ncbi:hypothetical protein ACUXV3_07180 [Roseobacteraceae bacterium NS-SX3]
MKKKWFILFESGALLSRTGDKITYFYDEALSFTNRAEAQLYLRAHRSAVNGTGLRPCLTQVA